MRFIYTIGLLLLTACSSSLPMAKFAMLPQNTQLFKVEKQLPTKGTEQSLLMVQYGVNQWRWIQTDPLGAPIARLILTNEGWQNDGFVMPNPQVRQLFSAIATYLNPEQPPFIFEKVENNAIFYANGKKLWEITPHFNGVWIQLDDKSQWFLEELKGSE